MEGGKKGNPVLRFIFSRSMITLLLLLAQIAFLLAGFLLLGAYMQYVLGVMTLLSSAVVLYIINKKENAAFKIAWMLPVLLLPVLGTFLYLFITLNVGNGYVRMTVRSTLKETASFLGTKESVLRELHEKDERFASLAGYVEKVGGYPVYGNTEITYFPSGEEKFRELKDQLEKAEKFIFLEYFIIERGMFWDSVLEILKRKVQEGVEVRVLYDGMCSLVLLPFHYPRQLGKFGIKARMFSPIRPLLSTHQNNRDHRKIAVIDGRVAFNGGINLGDEYINISSKYGHWKDVALMARGDAVKSYTAMFLQMWNAQKSERDSLEDYGRYIGVGEYRKPLPADGYVMPYADGPHQDENLAENIYMDILHTADRYVHIMTPYLILDDEMLNTLIYTAKRGIDVKIIMPHIPDKWVAFAIAKTYYPQLLYAGVKIFEYTPGFVHAKCFVSDDEKAVVGTINLDYRSLFLHFECATFLYRNRAVTDIEQDYQDTLGKCQEITMEDYRKSHLFYRITGRFLRVFGPLL